MACLSATETLRHWTLKMHSLSIDGGSEEGKGRPEPELAGGSSTSAPPALDPASCGSAAGGTDGGGLTAMVGAAPNEEKRLSWSSSNMRSGGEAVARATACHEIRSTQQYRGGDSALLTPRSCLLRARR
jgi:hypothetical protein